MFTKGNKKILILKRGFCMQKKGFTLIELMVVIVIMGILAAVAVPKLTGVVEKSRRGIDILHAGEIKDILLAHYASGTIQFPTDHVVFDDKDGNIQKQDFTKKSMLAILVTRDGNQFYSSGNVLVNGKTWHDDKTNYQRIAELMREIGYEKLKLECQNPDNSGWDYYAVVLFSDGSVRITGDSYGKNGITNASQNIEAQLNNMLYSNGKTAMERAMGNSVF